MNNINKEIVTITMATTLMLIIMITITIRKNYWNDTIKTIIKVIALIAYKEI